MEASIPLDPPPPPEADDKRLWIGNIGSRLTEYNLLKIVQQFGKIKKFDFLFHKSGHMKGLPRGYCFVTYDKKEEAVKAMKKLDGKHFMDKELVVKWAHTAPSDSVSQHKVIKPVCEIKPDDAKKFKNSQHQILAIEAKLKAMQEQREKELELSLSSASKTTIRKPLPHNIDKRKRR